MSGKRRHFDVSKDYYDSHREEMRKLARYADITIHSGDSRIHVSTRLPPTREYELERQVERLRAMACRKCGSYRKPSGKE